MPGYDLSNKQTFRMMKALLGTYDKTPYQGSPVEGVENMSLRLRAAGGHKQQERMIQDKRKTLERALRFSYQAAEIIKVDAEASKKPIPALITPNRLSQDYDDKILSVGYEYNFKPGDVFEWRGTGTHWLIYLQNLTELAYFRGTVRRCRYKISWKDEDGEMQETWVAVKGPSQVAIQTLGHEQARMDIPNYTLSLLVPSTEACRKYFQRYTRFLLNDTCWKVEAVDDISSPGILEVSVLEDYINKDEDNLIVGDLIEQVEPEDTNYIWGETFIKPKREYEYIYRGKQEREWYVDTKKYPIVYSIDGDKITLTWNATYSGQFELQCGELTKVVVVESLF